MQKQSTILNSQPATYVKAIAVDIAQGALISGSEILTSTCKQGVKQSAKVNILLSNMSSGIVVGHGPRHGQESKKERKADR